MVKIKQVQYPQFLIQLAFRINSKHLLLLKTKVLLYKYIAWCDNVKGLSNHKRGCEDNYPRQVQCTFYTNELNVFAINN